MSTLMSMGPMLIMDNKSGGPVKLEPYDPHHGAHHMHPGPPPPQPNIRQMQQMQPSQYNVSQNTASSGQHTLMTSSMNRSQRCGVCRGCQCKPCGHCQYCQDSPQFGGPGVKKQSCIERRCLRVLENRLQRDAPTFKARVGCNQCEDCRLPDCQTCLVCLDKKFFENRYMTGAMCAKKRCNNATSIELPAAQNADLRQGHKRSYDQSITQDYQMLKRRIPPGMEHLSQPRMINLPPQAVMNGDPGPPPGTPMYPVTSMGQPQLRLIPPQMPGHPSQLLIPHPGAMIPISTAGGSAPNQPPSAPMMQEAQAPPQNMQPMNPQTQFIPQTQYLMAQNFPQNYFDDSAPLADPFLPPSYAPEMKNAVVLQPL